MVKLYAITVFYKGVKPVQKKAAYELSSFGFFQRSGVREFMGFTSEVLVERTQVGQRQTVKEQDYRCHVYVRSDSLGCVVIADHDYPSRVCFTLMNKVLDMYTSDFPKSSWDQLARHSLVPMCRSTREQASVWGTRGNNDLSYPPLDSFIKKYQDPKEADAMMRVQNDLDETKIVLHETIEHLLERGERLDDLVQKTDKLSGTSKAFYKEAKGGTCCVIQ